jgi:diaminopimelate decarboxylase
MSHFDYVNGELCAEQVPLARVAGKFGTPCYVYSRTAIEEQWQAYHQAFEGVPHLICYSVKANGNLAVLNLLSRLGSGFDVVSGGELQRVIKANGDPARTVFSGVGKTREEMQIALDAGIKCFNVESESELRVLNAVAGDMKKKAPVSIRVNPDVDARTHPFISTGLRENKFGISISLAESVYRQAVDMPHLRVVGIACHIGSQITSLGPYQDACGRVIALVETLRKCGILLKHIDVGGGLGITYHNEQPPAPAEFIQSIRDAVGDSGLEILIEPGRSIVGNAGVLLTTVLYLKENEGKHFAIVDAAMNDLIRPVLYDAWQEILPVSQSDAAARVYDVVGPVCESGDFLGLNRSLSVEEGALLAVRGAGAYGFSMSSNYNARPRAAEVMVQGEQMHEIRQREGWADLYRGERPLR